MLHELLLALNGYPGSIFNKNDSSEIQVVSGLPFVHPSEEDILARLCQLATHYYNFQLFIHKYGHTPALVIERDAAGDLNGLYLRAFCSGLNEVLQSYRRALLDLERELLTDPHLTVTHIQAALEEYHLLFPALSSVISQIKAHKAHGCYILDILHRNGSCGMPIVQNALTVILHSCHGVLYKQLSGWLLHGLMLDPFAEFFVQEATAGKEVTKESEEEQEDELGLAGITRKHIQQVLQFSDELMDKRSLHRFSLRGEMLPSYIPTRIAEKIVFAGESMQMFEAEKQTMSKRKGSIMSKEEEEFARELQELAAQKEFSLRKFENVIDRIRACVAEKLWELIVEQSNLISHLRTLKDFFLLGRGELMLAFIDQAHNLLKGPPLPTSQHDVNMAFQQAARNVLFDEETLLQQFKLTIDSKPTGKSSVGESGCGWAALGMTHLVEWPLHILFTPAVLESYNCMFKFLLAVKRVQLQLQQCWALQIHRKKINPREAASSRWWLRTHMAFLVDNLQYYLQVDVIESQFSILAEKIQSTRDFEEIQLAHDHFLSSLLGQSFLLSKPISHCLSELLESCHGFCKLVTHTGGNFSEQHQDKLDSITKNFQRQSNLLFKILSSVRSHQASPHLAQLLLRIDFNKYFTNAGGQLGSHDIQVSSSASSFGK